MPEAQKLILFELNEVPFRVFDYFIERHPNSNIAKLFDRGNSFETTTEDTGHLSPWITWPSVHRGVANSSHGITDFGQNLTEIDSEFPPIWQLLANQGVSVGMFGSLHSYPVPQHLDGYKFFVPDTFAAGPECFPEKLSEFQKFNLAMAEANSRQVSSALMLGKALPFLAAAPGLGLRARTAVSLARQLVRERANRDLVCRRRTSQVEIAFDFYLRQLKRTKPDISFFFSNHVASTMHRFWPGAFPEDYAAQNWIPGYDQRFSGEIEYTMGVADRFVGELMRFAENEQGYSVILLGSMGQHASEGRKAVNAQVMCVDLQRFMAGLGVPADSWSKRLSMAPQYVVAIDAVAKPAFLDRLAKLHIGNEPVDFSDRGDVVVFELGHANLPDDVPIGDDGGLVAASDIGLRNVQINDGSAAFAYHIPQGALVHYNPRQRSGFSKSRASISTLDIAPAILRNFGKQPHAYMERGFSLS